MCLTEAPLWWYTNCTKALQPVPSHTDVFTLCRLLVATFNRVHSIRTDLATCLFQSYSKNCRGAHTRGERERGEVGFEW